MSTMSSTAATNNERNQKEESMMDVPATQLCQVAAQCNIQCCVKMNDLTRNNDLIGAGKSF